MRRLAVLFALIFCAACARPRGSERELPNQKPNEIAVVVFNQRHTPVPFTLIIGDSVVLDTIARLPSFQPPIAMTATVTLHSGTYRVIVVDKTRGKTYEAKVRIPGDRARIEIWFDVGESNAGVVYGERIYQ